MKGIRLNVSKDENAPIELYDLSTDPSEQKNVAEKKSNNRTKNKFDDEGGPCLQ